MRIKFLNLFTVCLVTLAVLSPGLVVFNAVWERHIELVKYQNSTCESNNTSANISLLNSQLPNPNSSQHQQTLPSSKGNLFKQLLRIAEQYKLATIMQWFFILTPVCVGLGIIFYDRYLVYRAAVFQEQVEMLERLWQQSIEQ